MNFFGLTLSPSELIAALAIVSSLIISVVNVIFSYLTHRSSIRAKQREIGYEKHTEAFQEIVNAMSHSNKVINDFAVQGILYGFNAIWNTMNEKKIYRDNLLMLEGDFFRIYNKNRIYLSDDIDKTIQKYAKDVLYLDKTKLQEDVHRYLMEDPSIRTKIFEETVLAMRKFLQYE